MNVYFIGMLISMVFYIVISIVISRKVKDANDFYVAGRQAPTILITGSMVASFLSTGIFMGEAGESYSGIFSAMLVMSTIQTIGYSFGGTFFGRYLRRSEVVTIPEYFGKRFCSSRLRILATVTSLITLVVYLLSIMQGVGTLMSLVTGVDYNLCVFLALITFSLVTMTSGSKGVLITDTIMFGVFTAATVFSIITITAKGGGWFGIVASLAEAKPALLSWEGDLSYFYPTGWENILWGILYGIVWASVCMAGPWQISRYLMAKNEHVVIRSSVWSALCIFFLAFLISISAVFVNVFEPELESASHVLIWAAKNVLPTFLGVVMLTGVLAAGISSATTFLSLISASVANDIVQIPDDRKKMTVGRIAIIATSTLVMALAYYNPPAIFWVLYLGATLIACSWFPVCIASVWSKRVTGAGAFWGMLVGFVSCGAAKLYAAVTGVVVPLYLDSFVVGFVCNVVTMVVVSSFTAVSGEEKAEREKLFVIPDKEKDIKEIRKTKRTMCLAALSGVLVTLILLVLWAIPYRMNR